MADKFVPFHKLKDYDIKLGRRQIDRLEARGLFPKRVPLSPNRVAWLVTEIKAHVEQKIRAREAQP